jgi:hypothetical protein
MTASCSDFARLGVPTSPAWRSGFACPAFRLRLPGVPASPARRSGFACLAFRLRLVEMEDRYWGNEI